MWEEPFEPVKIKNFGRTVLPLSSPHNCYQVGSTGDINCASFCVRAVRQEDNMDGLPLTGKDALVILIVGFIVGIIASHGWHLLIRGLAGASEAERRARYLGSLKDGDQVQIDFRGTTIHTVIEVVRNGDEVFSYKVNGELHTCHTDYILVPEEFEKQSK